MRPSIFILAITKYFADVLETSLLLFIRGLYVDINYR